MLISPLQVDVCYCVGLKLTDVAKSTKPLYPHQDSAFVHVQFHSHQHTHTLACSRNGGWWFPYRPVVTVSGEDRVCAHTPKQKTILYMHRGAYFIYNRKVHLTHTPRCVNMGQQVAAQGEQAAAALHD